MTATRPFFAVRGSADEDEDGDGGADTDADDDVDTTDDEDGEDGGGGGGAAAETGASFLRSTRAERVARTFRAWEAAVSTLSATL